MNAVAAKPANKKMTDADYKVRRKRIDEQAEARQELVNAFSDQLLATRFYDSGGTQQELADKEGKTQPWVTYRICFGRFLKWANSANIATGYIPKNLTERRFRSYWQQTSGTKDTARFRKVWKMMQDETVVHGCITGDGSVLTCRLEERAIDGEKIRRTGPEYRL